MWSCTQCFLQWILFLFMHFQISDWIDISHEGIIWFRKRVGRLGWNSTPHVYKCRCRTAIGCTDLVVGLTSTDHSDQYVIRLGKTSNCDSSSYRVFQRIFEYSSTIGNGEKLLFAECWPYLMTSLFKFPRVQYTSEKVVDLKTIIRIIIFSWLKY